MIIGKDKVNNTFGSNYNPINTTQNNNNVSNNSYNNINTMKNANVLDKNEMHNKAFDMLQDRLNKGLITLDEFNKKCNQLNKK